jgi:hypothetical protein
MLGGFFALSMLSLPVVFAQGAFAQGRQGHALKASSVAARCYDNQLSVRHVLEDAAMGGVRTIDYAFTNTSSSPCTLMGYPRFEVLSRSGRTVHNGRAARGLTRMGEDARRRPRRVTLEPGKIAVFKVYYNAGGAGHVGRPCPTYRRVRIIAPGARRGIVLREDLELCGGLEVSPVESPRPE